MNRLFAPFILLLMLSSPLFGQESIHFESPESQTQILELYTSEGCSSCPPADRWLTKLKQDPRLWSEFIPLAFHVDYWNYLGWKDRFSSERFSNRQRQYASQNSLRTVYTPGFILNGLEWRDWFSNPLLKIPSTEKNVGKLAVNLQGNQLQIDFNPSITVPREITVNVVVLGFDLKTEVARGENHGRTLQHDFVVLDHQTLQMQKSKTGYMLSLDTPEALRTTGNKTGLVVWLSRSDDLTPIQATGGYL